MSINVSRSVSVSFDKTLESEIRKEAEKIIRQKIRSIATQAKELIGEALVELIKQHPVYKALNGGNAGRKDGSDLQAEFGLSNEMVDSALSELISILEDSVVIKTDRENNNAIVDIEVSAEIDEKDYEQEILNNDAFHYTSTPAKGADSKATEVYWMAFLLYASSSLIEDFINGVEDYGITFAGDMSKSRSGRAKMVTDGDVEENRSFPYIIPKRFVTTDGKNFIEEVTRSRKFRAKVNGILEDIINNYIK